MYINTVKKDYLIGLLILVLLVSSSSFAGVVSVSKMKITRSTMNIDDLQVSEVVAINSISSQNVALASEGAVASSNSLSPNTRIGVDQAINGVFPTGFPNLYHSDHNSSPDPF